MIEPVNFAALVDKAMILSGRGHMRPVIEKELLHYDILFSLDREGLLDILTFQGGTSLPLCYGAPRFSEDLDFAGVPGQYPALCTTPGYLGFALVEAGRNGNQP